MSLALTTAHGAVLVVGLLYIITIPFTKVEESFNVQATHDILHNLPLSEFDHFEFPGVVPRTFIGPLLLSVLSYPAVALSHFVYPSGVLELVIVRLCLFLLWYGAYLRFAAAARGVLPDNAVAIASALLAANFHTLFYASRPLANTFAAILVLLAMSHWLQLSSNKWHTMCTVVYFVMAVVWFRCDMLLLAGPVLLTFVVKGQFFTMVLAGIVSSFVAIAATVAIDSYFWGRWIWPEFEVFWYNAVLNKSHLWGISPWHWYATSALPRAMTVAYGAALAGLLRMVLTPTLRWKLLYFTPPIVFISAYSALPHKEMRFILPAVPVLFLLAGHEIATWPRYFAQSPHKLAKATSKSSTAPLPQGDQPSSVRRRTGNVERSMEVPTIEEKRPQESREVPWLYSMTIASLLVTCGLCTGIAAVASFYNYPGGVALQRLHAHLIEALEMKQPSLPLSIHIDAFAAMTGVSRFGQRQDLPVVYDKTEHLNQTLDFANFDYLLTQNPTFHSETFQVIHEVPTYAGLSTRSLPKLLLFKPGVYIMERRT